EHKNASLAPGRRCKSARYLRVSLWFAPCPNPKSIVFICSIKHETLHWLIFQRRQKTVLLRIHAAERLDCIFSGGYWRR
ncbi:hypothetical protein, partial [Thiomonas sp.]